MKAEALGCNIANCIWFAGQRQSDQCLLQGNCSLRSFSDQSSVGIGGVKLDTRGRKALLIASLLRFEEGLILRRFLC